MKKSLALLSILICLEISGQNQLHQQDIDAPSVFMAVYPDEDIKGHDLSKRTTFGHVYVEGLPFCFEPETFGNYFVNISKTRRGRPKYGIMDILGNDIVPAKYSSPEHARKSRFWNGKQGFRERHADEYAKKREYLEEKTAFSAMLSGLNASRSAAYGDILTFTRGKARLYKAKIQDKYCIADDYGNMMLDTLFSDILLLPGNQASPLFRVMKAGGTNGYVYVDYAGNECRYSAVNHSGVGFKDFLTHYVNLNFRHWTDKDEFEDKEEYLLRNSAIYRKMACEYYAECGFWLYMDLYPDINPFELGEYDKDNESFLIKSPVGEIGLEVPSEYSRQFRADWNDNRISCSDIRFRNIIDKDTSAISIMSISFSCDSGQNNEPYSYSGHSDTKHSTYTVKEDKGTIIITEGDRGTTGPVVTEERVMQSDIDIRIPETGRTDENTFAIIISNENYDDFSHVPFAQNDGVAFKKYCISVLGIPENNITYREDATLNRIEKAIRNVGEIISTRSQKPRLIFYYAGHGCPESGTNMPCLLPSDAYDDSKSWISKDWICSKLSAMDIEYAVAFFDCCFSGVSRDDESINKGQRHIIFEPAEIAAHPNVIVFNATSDTQAALPIEDKGHGLFTYYLLKKIQQTQGELNLGELFRYTSSEVANQSHNTYGKVQTPTVEGGLENWESLKL